MLRNKVSLEGDGGQFDERDTLVVRIKRWSRQHALLLGPTIEELKEDNKFADVLWPEIGDIEAESVEDILLPMPSSYAVNVRTHQMFKTFIVAECNLLEGRANDLLRELRTKLTCQALIKKDGRENFGQIAKTRNTLILERTKESIRSLKNDYNAIFETMSTLNASLNKGKYYFIEDSDIIPFNLYNLKLNQKKEGIPWIWKSSIEILHTDKQIDTWNLESMSSLFV